jgi:nicotinate-nucleotide--dimethylbenzimidazole phosphoribosyltransferase
VSVLTDTEPVKVLPRGATMTPEHWMAAAEAIRDDRRAVYGLRGDPPALLAAAATPDICAAVGFLLRAAARRTPMLVEGLAATVAALIAFEVQPRSARWWRAADRAGQPAAAAALSRMSALPVLDFGTDLGDGTAALLAADAVRTAAAIASDLAAPPRG